MAHTQTQDVLNRLARIRGHIDGIYKMVEAERSCPEIVVQIVAVRSALNQVAKILLKDHASHCLMDAAGRGDLESELASFRKALDLML